MRTVSSKGRTASSIGIIGLTLWAGLAIAQKPAPVTGTWADDEQQSVYAFLDNDRLMYWSKTKYHSDPNKPYIRSEGTWQSKDKMCWIGQRSGNVILYTDGEKCCMQAEASGDKLMLKSVWGEPQMGFGVCRDQVLSRINQAPDASASGTAAR